MRDPIEEERLKNKLLSYVKYDFEKGDYVSVVMGYKILRRNHVVYSYETEEIQKNLRQIANHYLDKCKFPDDEILIKLGELLLGDNNWSNIDENSGLAHALFNECFWSEHLPEDYKLWMGYCEEQLNFDDEF